MNKEKVRATIWGGNKFDGALHGFYKRNSARIPCVISEYWYSILYRSTNYKAQQEEESKMSRDFLCQKTAG